jgi:hypothetical protein
LRVPQSPPAPQKETKEEHNDRTQWYLDSWTIAP